MIDIGKLTADQTEQLARDALGNLDTDRALAVVIEWCRNEDMAEEIAAKFDLI